jgi:hypothetical protein
METTREQLTGQRRGQSGEPHEPLDRRGYAGTEHESALTPSRGRTGSEQQLARGLGWFSIGLGLTEIVAPRYLERFLGVRGHATLIRMMGLREIATGVAILNGPHPAGALWSRVGGDVIDLAGLAMAANSPYARAQNIALAGASVAGVTALDVYCAQKLSGTGE